MWISLISWHHKTSSMNVLNRKTLDSSKLLILRNLRRHSRLNIFIYDQIQNQIKFLLQGEVHNELSWNICLRNYDSCSDVLALWHVHIRNSCMDFQSDIVISSRVDIQSSKMVSYGDVMFGPFGSVWCKMILGKVGVSLPWWCHALVLAPGYWRLFFKSHNFFIMEKWLVKLESLRFQQFYLMKF